MRLRVSPQSRHSSLLAIYFDPPDIEKVFGGYKHIADRYVQVSVLPSGGLLMRLSKLGEGNKVYPSGASTTIYRACFSGRWVREWAGIVDSGTPQDWGYSENGDGWVLDPPKGRIAHIVMPEPEVPAVKVNGPVEQPPKLPNLGDLQAAIDLAQEIADKLGARLTVEMGDGSPRLAAEINHRLTAKQPHTT